MSNIFSLKVKDVIGAVVSAVIVSVLVYLNSVGTAINWSEVGRIALATGVASLLKSFTTDASGKFAGVVPVK